MLTAWTSWHTRRGAPQESSTPPVMVWPNMLSLIRILVSSRPGFNQGTPASSSQAGLWSRHVQGVMTRFELEPDSRRPCWKICVEAQALCWCAAGGQNMSGMGPTAGPATSTCSCHSS